MGLPGDNPESFRRNYERAKSLALRTTTGVSLRRAALGPDGPLATRPCAGLRPGHAENAQLPWLVT